MKKAVLLMLVFVIMVSSVCYPILEVSAEPSYTKKIVSIAYDDSGSMEGDKWAYANYAVQAFCGMLNSEDSLYITYMSDVKSGNPVSHEIDLTKNGIQNSVDTIRNRADECGSTPFGVVETAFSKLKNAGNSDKNTQYWLVVITDGIFDETRSLTNEGKKKFLNEKLGGYTSQQMPNGSNPRVTFMGIGDGVVAPDEDAAKKIYTYSADNATEITNVMSELAERVSGRTRLPKSSMEVEGSKIRIVSPIPLLNIAVFSQDTASKLVSAKAGNTPIDITRKSDISYPGYPKLTAGAYLLGDTKKVMGAGTYDIVFNGNVNINSIDILCEPALEVKIMADADGGEITDCRELENMPAGKDVAVKCKVYDMGTGKEFDVSKLPKGTNFKISVYENGQQVKTGDKETLDGYKVKNSETEFEAAVTISGFNPISNSVKFNPGKNIQYSVTPEYKGNKKSVRYNEISENKDMAVCFTVSHEGIPITDPETVKTFNPKITVSPEGNSGTVTYSNDGKIVFTPNATGPLSSDDDNLNVNVTCTLDNGTGATAPYTVVVAEYEVVPVAETVEIAKTEFFGNTKGVSFYITRDGVKLSKSDVEGAVSAVSDELYPDIKFNMEVDADGKITAVPYSETERKITFGKWWFNWVYYIFKLEGSDMKVTLVHPLATGESVIDVTGADLFYQIFNVYLPLLIELLIIAAIIAYIIRYFTKARFAPGAVLYVGSVTRNIRPSGTHYIELCAVQLSQFNTFKNLWNPFKELTVPISGISFTAAQGGKIICNEAFPWYCDTVRPNISSIIISSPRDIVDYCDEKSELLIEEIKTRNVMEEQSRIITQDDSTYYFVNADVDYAAEGFGQTEVMHEAMVFCYSTN